MKLARTIFALLFAITLAYAVSAPASAADLDCSDFSTPQEAQNYFLAGGGSPSYNYNNLDRDRDGYACEATAENTGGGGGDVPADTSGDVPDETGSDDVSELPNTGAGTHQHHDSNDAVLLAVLSLGTLGAGSMAVRRCQS